MNKQPESLSVTLIPNAIQEFIERSNLHVGFSPEQYFQVLVDNFPIETVNDIISSAFINLVNLRNAPQFAQYFISNVSSLSEDKQNFILDETVKLTSRNSDAKKRLFAACLLPCMNAGDVLNTVSRQLSLDLSPNVRSQIISVLPQLKIDDHMKKHLLINSCFDRNVSVRQSAASVFWEIYPEKIETFLKLMTDSAVSPFCLKSLKKVVSISGLSRIQTEYQTFLNFLDVDDQAMGVLTIARILSTDEDRELLVEFSRKVLHSQLFQSQLPLFIEFLNERKLIMKLLDPKGIQSWRLRRILMACLRYVSINEDLIPFALSYSCDECALIRNESVFLWKHLIEHGIAIESTHQLLEMGWQQRLVLSKIIYEIGTQSFDHSLIEKLSKDSVENVRLAMTRLSNNEETIKNDNLIECENLNDQHHFLLS